MTAGSLAAAAAVPAPAHSVLRIVERNLLVYRRNVWALPSGVIEPLLYLFALGFGLGGLVDTLPFHGRELDYAAFLAPALMATAAMEGAVTDSAYNLYFRLRYARIYEGVLATPVEVGAVAVGEVVWALLRGTLYSVVLLVAMAVAGLASSPWALLTVPAAALIGFAFGAVGAAASTFMRGFEDFDLVQLVLLPLFLFSATLFPLDVYPHALRVVAELSPLTRGVDLIRSFSHGAVGPRLAIDAASLIAIAAAGIYVTRRRLERLLLQ